MAISATCRPVVSWVLPTEGATRIAAKVGLVLVGTLLLAVAAHTTVSFWPVPMTLQTLALFAIAAAYGRNLAVVTVVAYLAQGAMGLPVFTQGAGFAYLAGPTGGYLAGFAIAAAIVGTAADRGVADRPIRLFGYMLVAEVIILSLGAAWLAVLFGVDKAIAFGIGPFIATDLVKIALAVAFVPALGKLIARTSN